MSDAALLSAIHQCIRHLHPVLRPLLSVVIRQIHRLAVDVRPIALCALHIIQDASTEVIRAPTHTLETRFANRSPRDGCLPNHRVAHNDVGEIHVREGGVETVHMIEVAIAEGAAREFAVRDGDVLPCAVRDEASVRLKPPYSRFF